jgi:hypothetical protein
VSRNVGNVFLVKYGKLLGVAKENVDGSSSFVAFDYRDILGLIVVKQVG